MESNKLTLQYIFNSYLGQKKHSKDIIVNLNQIDNKLLEYHRLDLVASDLFITDEIIDLEYYNSLLEKKNHTYVMNLEQSLIALHIMNLFDKNNVNYIFLKGLPLSIMFYDHLSHRYFSDIDILVDENDLDLIEKIMLEDKYKYGYFHKEQNRKIPILVSRKQVLFKRTFTHEIQNMIRIFQNSIYSNIDINFKFSWVGNNLHLVDIPFNELKNNILLSNEFLIPVLENELNFIHLACHFYNEAVFFLMDPDRDTTDTKELRFFRLLDICLVLKKCDIIKIISLSNKYKAHTQISYVLSIIKNFLKLDDSTIPNISKVYNSFNLSSLNDINYYYDKNGELQQWPITFDDRVLNLDKRLQICKKFFPISTD